MKRKSSRNRPAGKRAPSLGQIVPLYEEFEAAVAAERAIPKARKAGDKFEKAGMRAFIRIGKIADRIVAAPAMSIAEMLLKMRAIGWCGGADHKRPADLDHWQESLGGYDAGLALVTLREDLIRIRADLGTVRSRVDRVLDLGCTVPRVALGRDK